MGTVLCEQRCIGGDFTRCETEITETMPLYPRGEAKTLSAWLRKVPLSRKRLQ